MSESIIAVEHLTKSGHRLHRHAGPFCAISDFSLGAQETAAIVGASGSGKSTLLSIMAGLDTPSERHGPDLDGEDLFALGEDERAALRARKVGFVFQSFQLMGNLTALENVMLPLELAGRRDARSRHRDAGPGGPVRAPGPLPARCCPAASSSAWRWPAPSSCGPRCCWPTSPPAAWTSPPARTVMQLMFDLNREQGTTLVLVTHDRVDRAALRNGASPSRLAASRCRNVRNS
jgi:putative ABC transport system ATP-binding protein